MVHHASNYSPPSRQYEIVHNSNLNDRQAFYDDSFLKSRITNLFGTFEKHRWMISALSGLTTDETWLQTTTDSSHAITAELCKRSTTMFANPHSFLLNAWRRMDENNSSFKGWRKICYLLLREVLEVINRRCVWQTRATTTIYSRLMINASDFDRCDRENLTW